MYYQDITGHYNAYFNANEKMKGVYVAIDKAHKDNYKDVLPIFTYSDPKDAKGATADLDDVIKRLTLSVQVHKVSNWADDDFVMMGRANYLKGNYDKAMAFFKYTTTEYKNGVDYVKEMKKMGKIAKPTVKKKPAVKPKFEEVLDKQGNLILNKVDQRPSYTLMVHEPARAEALIWMAKTFSSEKKYTEAAAVIQLMRHDDKFYTNLDKDVELVDAENFLNQKDYNDAITPLEKYLTMTKKKSERVRPIFILAQIYEKKGDFAKASDYYKQVLDNRPSYEMEFYAKIKRAKLGNKSGSSSEIKKLLITMSHDGKYKDYLDQIYYELGEIVLGENNRAEARLDFHKSIKASTKNADQKALSYLRLAQMDYEEEYYVTSKFFYDSTVKSMSKTDTAYQSVDARDKTLGKLVKQIDIINTEDSLQRIANMSPAERSRFLKKLIADQQKDADAKASDKAKSLNTDFIKQGLPGATSTGAAATTDDAANSFYFYNTSARSSGYSDFTSKWGERKLEDNWRRKDKAVSQTDNISEVDSAKIKAALKDKDTTTIVKGSEEEKLMAGLPLTPEKMEKSNAKLIDAFYALGTVYKDDLQSYRKAILAFEELNKRFPKNKLELESFYQLYLLQDRVKNSSKADSYKNRILTDYPNSTIAKYLKDPTYLAELKKKENSLSSYYESAYKDYSSGMYASAEKKCIEADVEFKENKMKAKFDILNAMSLAQENRLTDYVESLNKIIAKYPGTPEKDQAQKWLTALNHSKLPQVDISKLPKDSLDAMDQAHMPVVNGTPNMDTTGRAAFLQKMEDARKAQAKQDAQNAELKQLADAKASANAPKDTSSKNTKPYKPLSRTERMDSIMKAERAGRNQNTAVPAAGDTSGKGGKAPSAPVANRPAFDSDTMATVYGRSDNSPHYIIVYFLEPSAFSNPMVAKIENFNNTTFAGAKLSARASILNKDNKLFVVKSFKNKDLATAYVESLKSKVADVLPGLNPDQYFLGAISQLNYDLLISSQKIHNYMHFYRTNYSEAATAPAGTNATPKDSTAKPATKIQPAAPAKDTAKHVTKPATPAAKDTISKNTPATKGAKPAKPAPKDTASTKPAPVKPAKPVSKDTAVSKPAPAAKESAPAKSTPVAATRPGFDTDTLAAIYGKSDGAPHYVIIYFMDPAAYSYSIVGKLDNFDGTAFPTDKLGAHATVLDNDNKLIHIKPFKDKDAAEAYIKTLSAKISEVMPGLNPDQYFLGSISTLNYSTLISGKKINNYIHFYKANYK